jgi:membrane protease YdiL (CAAX protease family)
MCKVAGMTSSSLRGWTLAGLAIALLGIPAIVSAQHLLLPDATPGIKAGREVLILALSACLLWIITKGERLPLSSVGFRARQVGRSLGWGVGLALVSFAAVLGCLAAYSSLGIHYGEGGSISRSLPVTLLTVTRAGFSEELFYRGYAIERIEALTGNKWLAALIPLLAFGLFHFWLGAAGVVVALMLGAIITAFYMWKRDLVAAMFAHFLVDFVPNVLLPLLG